MASKKTSQGKRYTPEQKQSVIDYVNQHNAEKGRGGVTAAVKKFGASALTISAWVKAGAASGKVSKGAKAPSKGEGSKRSKVLGELYKLDQEISAKRKELSALEAKFEKLKGSL